MKIKFLFFVLLAVIISSCRNDKAELLAPPVYVYADSVGGRYNGIDVYHHYFLATGENGSDTAAASVVVSIDSSASNRIIINSEVFTLDSLNRFNTVNPGSDFHIFDGGYFTFDSLGVAQIEWRYGSSYLSAAHYHTFYGTR